VRFEIEDAGGGCCLGPEVVVVRAEDGRGSIQCIPPQQGKRRQEVARRLALRGCDRLGARPGDQVLVCRGDLFELAVPVLGERGFVVERGPVSEETHHMAEDEHRRQLAAILGYEPRIRDRRYAALNLLLLAEARRRPALRRFWKANVRRPADMDGDAEAPVSAATPGSGEAGAPAEAPRRRRGGRGRSRNGQSAAGTGGVAQEAAGWADAALEAQSPSQGQAWETAEQADGETAGAP
jgi:hypothetical protein